MSFAQEMKDFVAGYQATSQVRQNKEKMEDDKAYRKEDMQLRRDQFEMTQANADRNFALAQQRAASSGGSSTAAADKAARAEEKAANAVLAGVPAPTQGYDEEAFLEYKNGGMVKTLNAANGALVEEDTNKILLPQMDAPPPRMAPPPAPVVPPMKGALPVSEAVAPAAAPAAIPDPAAPAAEPEAPPMDPAVAEATVAGSKAAVTAVSPGLIKTAVAPAAAIAGDKDPDGIELISTKGALSTQEWQELVATIDPNGVIPSYMKTATVLDTTYKFFLEKGQPDKAAKIAKGIIVLNKQITQTLGALAVNAIESGDMISAAKLLSDAGDQFPSGSQIKINAGEGGALSYEILDKGESLETGAISPEQFWQLATKAKDGSMYVEEMGRFASVMEPQKSTNITPEKALQITGAAYAEAMTATNQFQVASEAGAPEEELAPLREAARAAASKYENYEGKALSMGISDTDIARAGKTKYSLAVPDAPAAGAIPEEEGGFFNSVAKLGTSLMGVSDLPKQGAIPTEAAAATPQGNTPAPAGPATPKSKAEYDALPSGTQYITPDGKLKRKL